MFGNTDKPVEKIANDTFGITGYVDGLCRFITNCDTPMTISIQGDWGSGKTSMMNMIREKIKNSVCPIWFNTWQFSQFRMQDELSISLLYSLLDELDYNKESIKKVFGFLIGAAKLATGIITEKVAGGYAAGEITDAMSGSSYDYATEIKNLKNKFQDAINEKLRVEHKDRIVIFVDDLDRLQPEKAVELLEVLKIFLDCENCVYILAVDYEVVTQGIKKKFGDSVGEQKGKSFFDKIIQLPFKMPVAQYDISKYVGDMLVKMQIDANDSVIADYVSLITLSVGCNPRSMKRLFNTYLLLDIIIKSKFSKAERDDTNSLLFAIICMQTEFETLYRYIVSGRDVLDSDMLISLEKDIDLNCDITRELNITDDAEVMRVRSFMAKFNDIIRQGNSEISEDGIIRLKELLSFSTVTSVDVNSDTETKSDYDWKYRYRNKDIAKTVNDILRSEYKYELRLWLPRKNTSWHRISDVWGLLDMNSADGVPFVLDYSLKTDHTVGITTLCLSVYHNSDITDDEFDLLFKNIRLDPHWRKHNGTLQWDNALRFSDNEADNVSGSIAEAVARAISDINKINQTER